MMDNSNPLQGYALGANPNVSNNGIVVNGVYAVNGVINTVGTNVTSFPDPFSNQFKVSSPIIVDDSKVNGIWTSDIVEDSLHNQYTLTFKFSSTTYINHIRFDLLNVPCTWSIFRQDKNGALQQLSTGIINFYDTSSFEHLSITFDETLLFDVENSLVLVLTKSVTGTQYQFTVRNFLAKLIVKNTTDLMVSGSQITSLTTQNRLNFVETYTPLTYGVDNILSPDITDYWKCSPQPTSDCVVYFVIDLGSLRTLNRMFIDPLYSNTVFNLYWSYDNKIWTPVQRDFRLRRGFYELPNISARYLKFEFTQLTAEPYQLPFNSVERIVDVFPDWVDNFYSRLENAIPNIANATYSQSSAIVPNVLYNTQLSSSTLYGNATQGLAGNNYGFAPSVLYSPPSNSTTSVTDPTTSYKTLNQLENGSVYKPISDVSFVTRNFPLTGEHKYKRLKIQQTWHQAYFTGIKQLKFYGNSYTTQTDYPEFTDYFLTTGSGSIVSTTSGVSFRTPQIVTISGITTVSGGGYTGVAGGQLTTRTLSTLTKYNSFKLAALTSQWESFYSNDQTTLLGPSLTSNPINATLVGVSGTPVQIPSYSSKYSIWEITPSGRYSSIIGDQAGGKNLLTVAEANFTTGGWTGTNPYTNTTASGLTYVSIPFTSSQQWDPSYGESSYGLGSLGASTSLGSTLKTDYTFLVTVSGSSDFTFRPVITYSGTAVVNGAFVASGTVVTGTQVSGSGTINYSYFTKSPPWASQVSFSLVNSGTVTYSKAAFMPGSGGVWTSPLITRGMRISAMARIYLPDTNNGTYRCSLYSQDTELSFVQYSNLPLQTWLDLEVPFTLTSGYYDYGQFNVRLTQNSSTSSEKYRIALLGLFYNPIALEYSIDGTNWNWVTNGVNNPYASFNLPQASNQLQLRATLLKDQADLSAVSIVPNYQQSPFYSTTDIDYLGDPKTNEVSWRRSPSRRPLFQLGTESYPTQYDQTILMNIRSPFNLS